jgi:hypothetical protein
LHLKVPFFGLRRTMQIVCLEGDLTKFSLVAI